MPGVSGIMLTASNLAPKEIDLVHREIKELKEALEAFKAAVEAGEGPDLRPAHAYLLPCLRVPVWISLTASAWFRHHARLSVVLACRAAIVAC